MWKSKSKSCKDLTTGHDSLKPTDRYQHRPESYQENGNRHSSASLVDTNKIDQVLGFLEKGTNLTKIKSKKASYGRFHVQNSALLRYETTGKVFGKKLSRVLIGDISDVLEGANSDSFVKSFRANKDFADRSCCFSIVIESKQKTLDLIAPDADTRNLWVVGLKHLVQTLEGMIGDAGQRRRLHMKQIFCEADKNGDGTLDFKEVIKLMQHLNAPVDIHQIRVFFEDAEDASSADEVLNEHEFIRLYFMLTKRQEVVELFNKYSTDGIITAENLAEFFRVEQKETLGLDQCRAIIRENEHTGSTNGISDGTKMTSIGFDSMMDTAVMDIKRVRCRRVYQDMNQPLSHYFVDSSHNTYLASNQLVGESSVQCYIRALKMGCRCVELDVWDADKENGEPVVYHGHTLTSKILLREVLQAINQYAFEASEYPVILSIENHLNYEQQQIMAKYLVKIFGSSLLLEPLPESCTALPSPNDLRRKIIVKNKKLSAAELEESESDEEEEEPASKGFLPNGDSIKKFVNGEVKPRIAARMSSHKHKHKLCHQLSDCVVICQSAPFKGFNTANKNSFKCIASLSEGKANKLAEEHSNDLVRHTTSQMVRIYPAGSRADSSNYDPVPLWTAGCQVVALNYQTPDDSMYYNKGMFEDNGRVGYVLKPSFMRDPSTEFDAQKQFSREWKRLLKFTVISGHQLPKKPKDRESSIVDPFVVVDIVGLKVDKQSQRTHTIENNGNPVWNYTMTFPIICPHLALVLFRVFDYEEKKRDVVVAQYCLPFRCMQKGYRTIHLKNIRGEPLMSASLFVKIEIENG